MTVRWSMLRALTIFLSLYSLVQSNESNEKSQLRDARAVNTSKNIPKIAIVGEGVIGLSTATAILDLNPKAKIIIYHDKPFEEILSKSIAGLFRIDDGTPINIQYGKDTFEHLAKLWRKVGGFSGVQLVSGHIVSDNKTKLQTQEDYYGKIVTNFRWLEDWELHGEKSVFDFDKNITHGIHYTAFTSEGAHYCPYMKKELEKKGVEFVQRRVESLDELADEGHRIVVNCAGYEGGALAGDDAGNMKPIRGVLIKLDAPWHKHFLYRDFGTITIPTINTLYVGTVKQEGVDGPLEVLKEDIDDIWRRYNPVMPALSAVKDKGYFVGIRPGRDQVRVEAQERTTKDGTKYRAVHNYGHGGNGFTLAYGSGLHAAYLALGLKTDRYINITPKPLPLAPIPKKWIQAHEFYMARAAKLD